MNTDGSEIFYKIPNEGRKETWISCILVIAGFSPLAKLKGRRKIELRDS